MPWMLPVGLVSGVFMSPWASNQMRPIFSSRLAVMLRRRRRWCPWRSSGRRRGRSASAPRPARPSTTSRSASQVCRISFRYLSLRVAGVAGLRDRDVHVAEVRHVVAELAHAGVDLRPPEGGRAHVHAAPARAEVEGNADERDFCAGMVCADASTRSRDGSTKRRRPWLSISSRDGAPPPSRKAGAAPARRRAEPTVDILPILVARKVLTAEQAERVRRTTRLNSVPARAGGRAARMANEVQIAQAIAAHAGLPYVKINPLDLDLDVVTKGLSGPFARKHGLVAISKTDDDDHRRRLRPLRALPRPRTSSASPASAWSAWWPRAATWRRSTRASTTSRPACTTAEKQLTASRLSTVDLGNQEFLSGETKELDPAAAPVVKALDHILSYAFEQRASDIHFEPKRELTLVRLRIDGILHDVHLIPKIVYQAVVSRIKLLSGLQPGGEAPPPGRPHQARAGRARDRAARLHHAHRLRREGRAPHLRPRHPAEGRRRARASAARDVPQVPRLHRAAHRDHPGHRPHRQRQDDHALLRPQAPLQAGGEHRHHRGPDRDGVRGLQPGGGARRRSTSPSPPPCAPCCGRTPTSSWSGEIRDTETAEHAVQAALTGHLVLSTLHTNDAPSSITRLLDLGIPHFLITTTLIGILAQRLVREICTALHRGVRAHAGGGGAPAHGPGEAAGVPVQARAGLPALPADGLQRPHRRLRGAAHDREGARGWSRRRRARPDIFKVAREEGMRTLREAAIEKVFRGITTTTEMARVTGK